MTEVTGIKEIIKPENLVYKKTSILTDNVLSYCPGCGHSTAHRILAEIIEEEGLQTEAIGVSPVGCSVFLYNYLDIDWQEAAHGRAPAVATAIKRLMPEKFVFTYQGDGDLAAIGTAETIHACNRGENIMIIFINNGIYGMTGGQMAPTTIPGMRTSTSPSGRDIRTMGNPLKMTDIVATLPGTYYVTGRVFIHRLTLRRPREQLEKQFSTRSLNEAPALLK